jgi:hypothetical protein
MNTLRAMWNMMLIRYSIFNVQPVSRTVSASLTIRLSTFRTLQRGQEFQYIRIAIPGQAKQIGPFIVLHMLPTCFRIMPNALQEPVSCHDRRRFTLRFPL